MTRPPLCIYHGGCDDGFGAAVAVHMALDGNVELFGGRYQLDPPSEDDLRDRDVLFVDFSYKEPVLRQITALSRSTLVLDHHATAQADLGFLGEALPTWADHIANPGHRALFDMTRSGAMITWQYFAGEGWTPPLFYQYLQDRDLWLKQLPYGDEFTIALRSYPQEIPLWRAMVERDEAVTDLISEGGAIHRYYRQRVEEIKGTARKVQIGEYVVWAANAPYFAASEVAGELAEDELFGACYFHNGDGWQFSLRSRGDFHVGDFARQFGGGGHPQAAGFTVPTLPWLA